VRRIREDKSVRNTWEGKKEVLRGLPQRGFVKSWNAGEKTEDGNRGGQLHDELPGRLRRRRRQMSR